ncbi:PREDICTED: frataxin homolog, mitochondrial [Dinoponera quadriceps]|uniref:ferroxidase n=1 Tax=Dinoponera quadriceps TaxID=609295 RepID=A0A6P3WRD6_DINQU|nr:PREDICTED: frataxin homolog, mitochondrial [Dinoponera quadriceps]
MFTVRRSDIISRLSCSLFDKSTAGRFVSQFNRCSSYVGGYVGHHSTRFLRNNYKKPLRLSARSLSFSSDSSYSMQLELSTTQYQKICEETLESLYEYFEEVIEAVDHLPDADVSYGDGVLTVEFGKPYGTYVINRQIPNKQIWLASPRSGPKRYDFLNGRWIYKHDGKTIHELLNNEISMIVRNQVYFDRCSYSGKEKQPVIDSLSSQD